MPIAKLTVSNRFFLAQYVKPLIEALPGLIVRHLGLPGTKAELVVGDVECEIIRAQSLGYWGVTTSVQEVDFKIVIEANDYRERRDILEVGTKRIEEALRQFIPADATAYIWVRLMEGFYMPIQCGQRPLL
ncbi:MAG: hypothetical protein V4526_02805 [Patescibacteria group bacterium]